MNKTERKAIEKLALSAYAVHLYEGLLYGESYTLPEVIRYWRYAKEDVGAIAPNFIKTDANIFLLMESYKYNVTRLEEEIARQVAIAVVEDWKDRDNRIEIAAAKLPETFELRAFPGVTMQVTRAYSYVNDDGQLQLVLERLDTHEHFGKGTLAEIQAQIAGGAR